MDINDLVKVTAKAWSLPILAHLHRGTPGRQAALITATGAGRTAFGQSLNHLIAQGYLERNPGHGHPLRPEFRLTEIGALAGAAADRVLSLTPNPDQQALLRKTWSLPVLRVSQRPRLFSGYRQLLPPITDRALSQSLQRLEACHWIKRTVDTTTRPARAYYIAQNAGIDLGQAWSG